MSMQGPDRDVLDGKLKNNFTVRMRYRCADLINCRIIGTPGNEKFKDDGRMLLKSPIHNFTEIQAPYVGIEGAKNHFRRVYKGLLRRKNLNQPFRRK